MSITRCASAMPAGSARIVSVMLASDQGAEVRISANGCPVSVARSFHRRLSARRRSTRVPSPSQIVPPGSQWRPEYDATCRSSDDSTTNSHPTRRLFFRHQTPSALAMRASPSLPPKVIDPTRPEAASTSKALKGLRSRTTRNPSPTVVSQPTKDPGHRSSGVCAESSACRGSVSARCSCGTLSSANL
jgi:hypothetical protein